MTPASFVSMALRMTQTETRLKVALGEQEALAKEMSHRVKNVFNIVDGMISLTAKGAASTADLAQVLSGRVGALQSPGRSTVFGFVPKAAGPSARGGHRDSFIMLEPSREWLTHSRGLSHG